MFSKDISVRAIRQKQWKQIANANKKESSDKLNSLVVFALNSYVLRIKDSVTFLFTVRQQQNINVSYTP